MPFFEYKVKNLCERILACKTEDEAIILTQELKALLHEHVEELRGSVVVMRDVADFQVA